MRRACRRPRLPAARPLALEQRFMFDAAAVAATADAAHAARPEAARQPRRNARCRAAGRRHAGRRRPGPRGHGRGSAASRDRVRGQPGQDYQQLVAQVRPGTEVIVLDKTRDGLQQIADAARRSGIDAIHIIGHGAEGSMRLGSVELNAAALGGRENQLAAIGAALTAQGDILLYGCDIGANARGAELLSRLAQLTHADVAASNDRTGAAARGGDWVLEAVSGSVETAALSLRLQRPVGSPAQPGLRKLAGHGGQQHEHPGDRRSALRDQQHRHHRRDQCGRYLRPDFPGFSGRAISNDREGRSRQQFL